MNATFCMKCEMSVKREARGGEKIKRLLPVHCSGSQKLLLTEGRGVKRTNQNAIQYLHENCHLSG